MTPLAFPDLRPSHIEFGLVAPGFSFVSPLTGAEQTRGAPGARWRCVYTFERLDDVRRRTLAAFLAELDGIGGRFAMFDFAARSPRGAGGGTPVVDGAGQDGRTLATRGWPASTSAILLPGDYVAFETGSGRRELKMVVEAADSDASGEATVRFTPPIRRSPADGTALVLEDASCIARLEDGEQARWAVTGRANRGEIGFAAIESFEGSVEG